MLINKNTHVMEKTIFEYVVKDYNKMLSEFKNLNIREMTLKQACDVLNGYNFTQDVLFDFDSTWFIGTVMQMDGYLKLSDNVEIYDFEGCLVGQYDISKLVQLI